MTAVLAFIYVGQMTGRDIAIERLLTESDSVSSSSLGIADSTSTSWYDFWPESSWPKRPCSSPAEYESLLNALGVMPDGFGEVLTDAIEYIKKHPRDICELYLDGGLFSELGAPSEIGQFGNVLFLRLDSNQLQELPPELGNLTKLKNLDLTDNNLTQLPEEIGNLTQLEELDASYNELERLPEKMRNLSNLKLLDLRMNNLSREERLRIRELLPATDVRF
ncbi:MAG: leucine-rich repeat domain-containing protein [Acidobacteria bacterium]|nr:leucine-rich repeat domain-containing protein [Acidobacteriota bacterium]